VYLYAWHPPVAFPFPTQVSCSVIIPTKFLHAKNGVIVFWRTLAITVLLVYFYSVWFHTLWKCQSERQSLACCVLQCHSVHHWLLLLVRSLLTLQYVTSSRGVISTTNRFIAGAVGRRPLTGETQARYHVSPCGICSGQSGTGTNSRFFPFIVIPPMHHSHLDLHIILSRRTNGRNLGTFQKQCTFDNRKALERKSNCTTVVVLWLIRWY
jgi:hypothetical protein